MGNGVIVYPTVCKFSIVSVTYFGYGAGLLINSACTLFPGHRYLGHGNPINNEQPVAVDDAIAEEHDIAYTLARMQRAQGRPIGRR